MRCHSAQKSWAMGLISDVFEKIKLDLNTTLEHLIQKLGTGGKTQQYTFISCLMLIDAEFLYNEYKL